MLIQVQVPLKDCSGREGLGFRVLGFRVLGLNRIYRALGF